MSRDEPPQENGRDAPAEEFKAFVGGISWHMNDRELKDSEYTSNQLLCICPAFANFLTWRICAAFRKYNAKDASVMLDKMTGRSRGFGFVSFDNEEELKEAVRQMHDSDLDGRKISCTRAIPQSQTAPGTPASALAGGPGPARGPSRYGGGPDRYRERALDRAAERPPPRGYAGRTYDDRRYDRGSYGGNFRQPERAYDRGSYPPAEYDRGYDRGYPPPSYR